MRLSVRSGGPCRGRVRVPGDKSLAHRALLLAALAEGVSRLDHVPDSQDVLATQSCLRALGAGIDRRGDSVRVRGCGPQGLLPPRRSLDAGNSGTTARLLLGLLAAQPFAARLTGDASLRRRPMRRVAEPLRRMGARVELSGGERLPALVRGAPLRGIRFASPVASAQLKSAVLIAGLFARGRTSVREPQASRDHTERLLPYFGARLKRQGLTAVLEGPCRLRPARLRLPADPSSAAPWVVAATLVPGSRLLLPGVGANPSRTGYLRALRRMGAHITASARTGQPEPACDLVVTAAGLRSLQTRPREAAGLIDEFPLLALAASQAEGTSRFRGLGELRHKESDRLAATLRLLRTFGGRASLQGDDLEVVGPVRLRGARFDPRGDHRMAMAAAVAGLIAQGPTTVAGAECLAVSYPGFAAQLRRLTGA